jgi:hypothetical protein
LPRKTHPHKASLRNDEFLDFDRNRLRGKLPQDHIRNVDSKRFKEFPRLFVAKSKKALANSKVIDGLADIIGRGAGSEIGGDFDGKQQALGSSPFLVWNTD